MKKWNILNPDKKLSEELSVKGGLPKLCADVLTARGIDSVTKAQAFFGSYLNSDEISLSDPFLIKDMEIAAEHILESVDCGKKICIYGDYDCDGIISTVILYQYISCIGGDVSFHINTRSQGYGMCGEAVRTLAEDGAELIITVDNGISAVNEALLCSELGVELIITDHHQPSGILPEAVAIVNPHRTDDMSPYKDLCGCGVVLKLIAALDGGDYSSCIEQFSDLAAIATVADIVPLTEENREIVRHGLHYLENTENPGLQALIGVSGIKAKIDSASIAYILAPRINAAGRFGCAPEACRMLLTEDSGEAQELADKINSLNTERKNTEKSIMDEIRSIIEIKPEIIQKRVIVLYGSNWNHGVIGIIASKLVENFGRPVFIMSDDDEMVRGSARGVGSFNVFHALSACSDLLVKFGGHSGAGGFSLLTDKITEFDGALQHYAAKFHPVMPAYTLTADKIILPEELSPDTVKSLQILEPFGEGCRKPLFAMVSVKLLDVIPLSGGMHTKLKLKYGASIIYGLMFGVKTEQFPFKSGSLLDMLVYPEVNVFNGDETVNVRIADYRRAGLSQQKILAAYYTYENYIRGESIDLKLLPNIVPSREELIIIYKAVPKTYFVRCDDIFGMVHSEKINYCKFRLAVGIFEELKLFEVDRFSDTVRLSSIQTKVQLENSSIFNKLNKMLKVIV